MKISLILIRNSVRISILIPISVLSRAIISVQNTPNTPQLLAYHIRLITAKLSISETTTI